MKRPRLVARQLVWSVRRRLRNLLVPSSSYGSEDDDFDWSTYSDEYGAQLAAIEKSHTLRFQPGDLTFRDGLLQVASGELRPHLNHLLLYETILMLQPESLLEAGCGAGDHLANLEVLLPSATLTGVDRSVRQIELLRRRNPHLRSVTGVVDLTLPAPASLECADLVYSQAVVMHIHTGNSHLVALSNMFRLARKQVVMIENWNSHDYVADIRKLQELGITGWSSIYCYVRRKSRETEKASALVVSSKPLQLEEVPHDRPFLG